MENNYTYVQDEKEKQGSLMGGIIGALVGATIGAVIWMLIGMLGYIVGLVGFLIAFLASKGYDLLKGRPGAVKVIVLIVCVLAAICVGTLGTTVWDIHNEYNELSEAERKYMYPPESELIRLVLSDSEVQIAMLKDAGLGLLFGFLGAIDVIRGAKKMQQNTAVSNGTSDAPDAIQPDGGIAAEQPSTDEEQPA